MQSAPRFLTALCFAALSAAGLRAQETAAPPPPSPNSSYAAPPPAAPPASWAEAEVDAEYAFRMRTWGLNAEIGAAVSPNHFLGFQYEYYGPRGTSFDRVAGPIHSREDIDTFEFAYRFRHPLAQFANGGIFPLSLYAGASAGLANVTLRSSVPQYGFSTRDEDDGRFAAGAVAGLEWAATSRVSVKVGYRYIYLRHVELFGNRANIDTGALETGVNFRW
jgi:hypothetical protein